MAMSKADFELIADVFRRELADAKTAFPRVPRSTQEALHKCALTMAHALRQQNPRFDHERFMRACCGWETDGQ